MGDKTDARKLAEECGVPVVPGSEGAVLSAADAAVFAGQAGYPVILKAAYGGGGRGMRVVRAGTLIYLSLHCALLLLYAHCSGQARASAGASSLCIVSPLDSVKSEGRAAVLLLHRRCAVFDSCVDCCSAFAASGSYSPGAVLAVPALNHMDRWLSKHPLGVKAALGRFGIAWFGTQMYG